MTIAVLISLLGVTAIAATFNVVSALLGLGLLPEFPGSWVFFAVKTYVADFLLWLVLGSGVAMMAAIWRDRAQRRQARPLPRRPLPEDLAVAVVLTAYDDADMVVGNRVTPGLVDRGSQMDSFFVWGNQVGAKLIQLKFWEWRFLGRTRLSDLGCTMRALRSEALAAIVDDLKVGGNHFSPHMIMVALRRGLLTVEVPVTFWPRVGPSKGASQSLRKGILIGLAMLWHILTFPSRSQAPYRPATADALPVERGRKAA